MKTKFLSYLTLLAVATGFSACNDDTWNNGVDHVDGEGQLNTENLVPEINNAERIISDVKGPNKAASRASIDLSNYIITVTNNATSEQAAEWTYSTMPSLPTFGVGTYTLAVESHKVAPVAWDEPYFLGTETFQIRNGEITEVSTVVCKLANIRVSVLFDDELLAASAGDINVTVTSADNNQAVFTTDETRSAYFQAMGKLKTLEVHFKGTVSGTAEDFVRVLTEVEAGQHRKITFGLKQNPTTPPDEFGNITDEGEGIKVSTSVTEEDLTVDTPIEEENGSDSDRPNQEGDEPGGDDDPNPPTPPVEDAVVFESAADGYAFDFEGINQAQDIIDSGKKAQVIIKAEEGIEVLRVDIISNSLNSDVLTSVGLASSFDLAHPSDLETALKSLGFATGDEVLGNTEVVFDITEFMTLLQIYSDVHEFKITVTDQKGNSKPLSLKIQS